MAMADTIATAADYADAMMTARKAKNMLFLVLLLILLIQLAVFFTYAYTDVIAPRPGAEADAAAALRAETAGVDADVDVEASTQPATEAAPATPATAPATAAAVDVDVEGGVDETGGGVSISASSTFVQQLLRFLTGLADFLGITLSVVLASVLLLIVIIMLVGRLIGVSRVTSAYIWTILFLVIMFPWQAFLDDYTWKPVGVLYMWDELMAFGRFMHEDRDLNYVVLKWWRFVGYPVVALIILLMIQVKSNRGIRQALGESTADVAVS